MFGSLPERKDSDDVARLKITLIRLCDEDRLEEFKDKSGHCAVTYYVPVESESEPERTTTTMPPEIVLPAKSLRPEDFGDTRTLGPVSLSGNTRRHRK